MRWQPNRIFALLRPSWGAALLVLGLTLFASRSVEAQGFAGVHVDAENVLRVQTVEDRHGMLLRQRKQAASAQLQPELKQFSKLRKVSLTRLEKEIEKCIEEGRDPSDEMLHLAGLQRIQYVFFYPETKDIVLAGPAEGWFTDPAGRVRGLTTQRPVLELRDMVTALRAFPPGQKSNPVVGCSIDPTQQGLQRMQQFLMQVGRTLRSPNQASFIVKGLKESLGPQVVTVLGVPATTHFAQVMVEADYRMKLIGIGLEEPRVQVPSYVDLVNPAAVAANALQRWYFTPDYECVRVSEDQQAMELVGLGVKLIGEDELVSAQGQRAASGTTNPASEKWTKSFTEKYEEIADKTPVYAQLRNLIDMLVVASFLQDRDWYSQADWDMIVFNHEGLFEIENLNTPKKVESAVNSIFKNRRLMTPIGGGVSIRAKKALSPSNLLSDEEGKLQKARQQVQLTVPADRWWWD